MDDRPEPAPLPAHDGGGAADSRVPSDHRGSESRSLAGVWSAGLDLEPHLPQLHRQRAAGSGRWRPQRPREQLRRTEQEFIPLLQQRCDIMPNRLARLHAGQGHSVEHGPAAWWRFNDDPYGLPRLEARGPAEPAEPNPTRASLRGRAPGRRQIDHMEAAHRCPSPCFRGKTRLTFPNRIRLYFRTRSERCHRRLRFDLLYRGQPFRQELTGARHDHGKHARIHR